MVCSLSKPFQLLLLEQGCPCQAIFSDSKIIRPPFSGCPPEIFRLEVRFWGHQTLTYPKFQMQICTFRTSKFQTPNNLASPKFQTPNNYMSTPVSRFMEFLPRHQDMMIVSNSTLSTLRKCFLHLNTALIVYLHLYFIIFNLINVLLGLD